MRLQVAETKGSGLKAALPGDEGRQGGAARALREDCFAYTDFLPARRPP